VGVEGLSFRSGESLLVADSIEQFADAVIHLATDINARRRIGRLARATAIQYDWETIGNRLCEAIEELAMRAVVAR
jgi:glycosyltransferase involved in cell wall biosynthesis